MMKHKQVSAIADTADPALVQPSDWNDRHVVDVGSTVVLGFSKFTISGTTVYGGDGWPNATTSMLQRESAGTWSWYVDTSSFESANLAPGNKLTLRPTLSVIPRGALTAGYYFQCGVDPADPIKIFLALFNSGDNNTDPNVACDITVTLFASVSAI